MKYLKYTVFIFIFIIAGFHAKRIDFRQGRLNNVCKALQGDVLFYFIFVDTKQTSNWTEYDITTTMDSIQVAINWLLEQAYINQVPLRIKTDYYVGLEKMSIRRNLPGNSLYHSVTLPTLQKGIAKVNNWSDMICRKAGESLNSSKKEKLPFRLRPHDTEKFILALRNEYKLENVSLMFFLNNYYRSDISIALNTLTSEDVEYAVVSYKYPAVIAHNFLHLFGAADMEYSPYKKTEKKVKQARSLFPNDIMLNVAGKNIHERTIGEYTQYLIGWKDSISPRYEKLFQENAVSFN